MRAVLYFDSGSELERTEELELNAEEITALLNTRQLIWRKDENIGGVFSYEYEIEASSFVYENGGKYLVVTLLKVGETK